MKLDVKVSKYIGADYIKIVEWYVKDGSYVEKEAPLCLLTTLKATFDMIAERAGYVKLLKKAGDIVARGDTLCTIDDALES